MLQVATRSANCSAYKLTALPKLLQIFKSRSRSLRRLKRRSDSMAKASKVSPSIPPKKVFAHCCTVKPVRCAFCGHCCGAAFIGGWTFEMIFVQPSCMRCNEHNKQGRLHSRLMQLSQRRRTLKRTGSTAKASKCFGAVISSPELPKETELCTLLYKPVKTCALFADSLAVPLSYRCSTRSKASVRKLCLLPTVLNDIRLSSRSCFRSFERKILRREPLLL